MLSVSTLGRKITTKGKTGKNSKKTWLFKNVTFDVHAGEMVALMGQSGSGKSTLLNCMSGLAPADEGTCQVDGHMLSNVSKRHLRRNLRNHVSLIFQDHHLIPGLTLLQNVQLARSLSDTPSTNATPHWTDWGSVRNAIPSQSRFREVRLNAPPLRVPWLPRRRSFSLMNLLARWMGRTLAKYSPKCVVLVMK